MLYENPAPTGARMVNKPFGVVQLGCVIVTVGAGTTGTTVADVLLAEIHPSLLLAVTL